MTLIAALWQRYCCLISAQSFDPSPYQPEWDEGKSCCKSGTQDQPNQVTIDQGVFQELGKPQWSNEQAKTERQINDREKLSKAAHDTAVHFTRIIPREIRPGNAER